MDEYQFWVTTVPQTSGAPAEVWVRLYEGPSIDAARGWIAAELGAVMEVRWETALSGVVVVRETETGRGR